MNSKNDAVHLIDKGVGRNERTQFGGMPRPPRSGKMRIKLLNSALYLSS